jgi:hypothetical protein
VRARIPNTIDAPPAPPVRHLHTQRNDPRLDFTNGQTGRRIEAVVGQGTRHLIKEWDTVGESILMLQGRGFLCKSLSFFRLL